MRSNPKNLKFMQPGGSDDALWGSNRQGTQKATVPGTRSINSNVLSAVIAQIGGEPIQHQAAVQLESVKSSNGSATADSH